MAIFNHFNLIGRCYGDCYVTRSKKGNLRVQFMLITKDSFSKKSIDYIPCVCYHEIAEQATLFCRDDNVIAIEGEVGSTEFFDKKTGTSYHKVSFIVTSIMLISKARKKPLSERKFSDIVELYQPDEFIQKINKESSEESD